MRSIANILFCILLLGNVLPEQLRKVSELFSERCDLIAREINMMLGNDIILSDNEQKANDIIMGLKHEELDYGFHYPQMFNLSKHFFDYKDTVKNTPLFRLIQQMPKGAVLHAHDTGLLSPDYILNVTYWQDLYVCFTKGSPQFLFSADVPILNSTCDTYWQLMRDARNSSGNVSKFDAELRKHFTIVIDNPSEAYTDVNSVWRVFQKYFIITAPLLTYKPIWEQYFYDAMKVFREDNIMYIEIRTVLPELYDIEGNTYDAVATAILLKNSIDQFVKDYPDFFGAKIIYAPMRQVTAKTVEEYINTARNVKAVLPDFLAGFDLVGQEDLGAPVKEFMKVLIEAVSEFDYFFHAGETNWNGMSSDENLADCIVLGTKRIGHGYAILKHPVLMNEVKKKDIALEVNVISNAVLKLVDDVRNHPVAYFVSTNMPVVLSSDDPGIWEAEPMSHDFYVAFVGVFSRYADLKLLKKLALNSLYYSTFSDKRTLVHEFEARWTKFIDNVVADKHA